MLYDGALQEYNMSKSNTQLLEQQMAEANNRRQKEDLQKAFSAKHKQGDHFSFAVLRYLLGEGKDVAGEGRDVAVEELRNNYQYYINEHNTNKQKFSTQIGETMPDPREWLEHAPPFSWFLKCKFTLKTPWFSRDDTSFSVTDNPLSLDRLTFTPEIKASSWKGLVSSSAYYLYGEEGLPGDFFGSAAGVDSEDEGRAGSLIFFPSFFEVAANQKLVRSDVITPLDKEKRTAILGPIHYPVVSEGSAAYFCLAYDGTKDFLHFLEEGRCTASLSGDSLEKLGTAISSLMLQFGFSAKSSSGYGVVEESFDDFLLLYRDLLGKVEQVRKSGDGDKNGADKLQTQKSKQTIHMDTAKQTTQKKQQRTLSSLADLQQIVEERGLPGSIPMQGVSVRSLKKQLGYLTDIYSSSSREG